MSSNEKNKDKKREETPDDSNLEMTANEHEEYAHFYFEDDVDSSAEFNDQHVLQAVMESIQSSRSMRMKEKEDGYEYDDEEVPVSIVSATRPGATRVFSAVDDDDNDKNKKQDANPIRQTGLNARVSLAIDTDPIFPSSLPSSTRNLEEKLYHKNSKKQQQAPGAKRRKGGGKIIVPLAHNTEGIVLSPSFSTNESGSVSDATTNQMDEEANNNINDSGYYDNLNDEFDQNSSSLARLDAPALIATASRQEHLVSAFLVEDQIDVAGRATTRTGSNQNNNNNNNALLVNAVPIEKANFTTWTRNKCFAFWIVCVLVVAGAVTTAAVLLTRPPKTKIITVDSSNSSTFGNANISMTALDSSMATEAPKDPKLGGLANTSTFWDCYGGACGCGYDPLNDGDKPAYCHGNALFRAPTDNPWGASFYGNAAISKDLGGDWWLGEGCGKCWKLKGTNNVGDFSRSTAGSETTIIVKGSNFCPPDKCPTAHFDIAAPGFMRNVAFLGCDERELNETRESFATCSQWLADPEKNNTDPEANCDCAVFNDPVLREGCENYLSLGWNEVVVEYEALDECPPELERIPCWEQNNGWPVFEPPEFCANPYGITE